MACCRDSINFFYTSNFDFAGHFGKIALIDCDWKYLKDYIRLHIVDSLHGKYLKYRARLF
jgi:hypothetical protein